MSTNATAQDLLSPYPFPASPPPHAAGSGQPGHEPAPYPDSGHGTQNLLLAPAEPGADPWFPTGGQSDEG